MKIRILVVATLFIFAISLKAQNVEKPTKEFKHGIGLAAGATTGYGLSYQYFPGKLGVQFTFGGIKAYDFANLSVGATFKMELIENEKANLYLYQANSLFYSSYEYQDWNYDTGEPTNTVVERNYTFNNGIGVGTDISLGKRLSLNVMGGVGSYDLLEVITITGEIAIFYRL